MELREWLIVLGLVFVVVIVIDGVRRYRKQQQIGSIDEQLIDNESDEQQARETAWELPSGSSRVVESERVAAPDLQGGSFERRGLKTRVPFTESGQAADQPQPFTEPHIGSDTSLKDSDIEASSPVADTAAQPHIADSADADPKAAEAAAHAEHTSANAQAEPALSVNNADTGATPAAEHQPVPVSSSSNESAEETAKPAAAELDQPAAAADETQPAEAPDESAYDDEFDDEDYQDDEQRDQRRYKMFHGEEEEIDDPRYEGLSEILVKRPMDGVHRFQEAAAERREKRAAKREQARVKRLEDRARRAEEKAKRREEKEREAEALRQQREEEERVREQQRREQEQQRREQEQVEQQRRAEYERQQRNEHKARAEHEAERNERLRREFEEQERQRHDQLRHDDSQQREVDHEDSAADDDPLFAPSRHDSGRSSDPRESAMRHGVPYLGAVDTFEEEAPRERSRRRRDSDQPERVAPAAGGSYAHEEREPAPRPAAERNWVRDLPEPEQKMHPVIEKALRHRVDGDVPRDVLGDADELIIINVVSRSELGFKGLDLTKLFLACGLNYASEGEMFHRFETEDPDSPLQFSIINALKPGRFPIFDMEQFSTRCVSFLLPLPSAEHIGEAFEAMYETARAIVRNLDGELRDENQSVMTRQTVGFLRQRVGDFERRMHLYRNSR
ncbi:cell division protein ZipA C-terminal FtsZ-binding domain-containing protein [Carnimonas bestiolae]|uniref:cell division protein ZipA C-terminal FtsZ-binding domain-containing protein n=1 Tax=Carnimonas bestiolae TaxID=3402172 RepID=UPI003EDC6E4B